MSPSLLSRQASIAWDLRGFLWSGKEVVLLAPDADEPRLRGLVVGVAPTDAVAWIDDARYDEPVAVALDHVVSVRQPHFHEEGDAPERTREVFEPRREAPPMPGQLRLGADRIPKVSPRSVVSMQRAAGMLLPQDLVDTLAALDRAARGRQSVLTREVAEKVTNADGEFVYPRPTTGRTFRRLSALATLRLVYLVEGRPTRWRPGD